MDFMTFITTRALELANRSLSDKKSRSLNLIAINIFNYLICVITYFYMWLIGNHYVQFNSLFFKLPFFILFGLSFILIHRKYKFNYERTIQVYSKKYVYSKSKISVLFIIIFFTPIVGIGLAVTIVRDWLY